MSEQEAEFNDDNDGATDVDASPDLLFYQQFIQSLGGERNAWHNIIVKPYLPKIFQLIRNHHQMYDIQVKDVTEKIPPKITTTANGGTY